MITPVKETILKSLAETRWTTERQELLKRLWRISQVEEKEEAAAERADFRK